MQASAPEQPAPLWRLGFRPFYLMCSAFAALSVLLWGAQFAGWLPSFYAQGTAGHGHEMIFGYAMGVVAGFLLTAVPNWTGVPGVRGLPLMALAALWLAGRILYLTPWQGLATTATLLFPLAVSVAIGQALIRSRNRRNYFFIGWMIATALIIGLNAWTVASGESPLTARTLVPGVDLVLFVVAVIGGRVIPMFTNNGVPGARATRHPLVEKLSLASIIALFVLDLGWSLIHDLGDGPMASAPQGLLVLSFFVAAIGAIAHAWRLWLWQPMATIRTPLVWVLHAAYAWIPIHLLLRTLSAFGWVTPSIATHALTVGAIGGMTIGMMTRTARGHTGRPLKAGRTETAAYLLVLLAAVIRVAVPALMPSATLTAITLSSLCWSAGFALYFFRYLPWLTQPRLDGRPG